MKFFIPVFILGIFLSHLNPAEAKLEAGTTVIHSTSSSIYSVGEVERVFSKGKTQVTWKTIYGYDADQYRSLDAQWAEIWRNTWKEWSWNNDSWYCPYICEDNRFVNNNKENVDRELKRLWKVGVNVFLKQLDLPSEDLPYPNIRKPKSLEARTAFDKKVPPPISKTPKNPILVQMPPDLVDEAQLSEKIDEVEEYRAGDIVCNGKSVGKIQRLFKNGVIEVAEEKESDYRKQLQYWKSSELERCQASTDPSEVRVRSLDTPTPYSSDSFSSSRVSSLSISSKGSGQAKKKSLKKKKKAL